MDKICDGLVKGVLSGDSVIISGKVDKYSDKAPEEYLLTFTLVNAPRTYTNSSKDEEPYGWEARDYLRGLVIGKVVRYSVDYRSGERSFGQVFVNDKNVGLDLVRKGLARVGNINKQNESLAKSDYYAKLQNFENEAKRKKENIWSGDKTEQAKHKRTITRHDDKDFDFKKVEEAVKGKEVDVMVEHVINCSGYVLFIKDLNCLVKFNPRFLAIPNSTNEPVIYKAGKAFVERLILHRDFKVKVMGLDDKKNFFGDIVDVKGGLVSLILRGGYTKVFTGSNTNITSEELATLKEAQQAASEARLRIWKNSGDDGSIKVATQAKGSDKKSFEGTLLQVHSGDSVSVKNKNTGELVRVFFSHLRAPKLGNANNNEVDQPWAFQAKEYLRKTFVGKTVFCQHDFSKTINEEKKDNKPTIEMNFYTVIKIGEKDGQDTNINAEVVRLGYAQYMTPRVDDQNVSKHLDTFSQAFTEAKEKKVGIHSSKQPGVYNYSDLFAANKQKIREFKDFLVGLRNTPCVVEHVISGSRFKLRIEAKKAMVPFNLLGIKVFQKDKNNTEVCNKLCDAAVDFANDTILQREGTCDIIQSDRAGNYFGYVYFNGENYGSALLKNGLGVVNAGMAGNFLHLNLYKKSEESAKENKVNIWKYDGLVAMLKDGDDTTAGDGSFKITEKNVDNNSRVSEFVDFGYFYVNYAPNKDLDKISAVLDDYTIGKKKGVALEPPIRKGVLCAARYVNDDSFYRAMIHKTFKEDKYEVEFIDFGTSEEVESGDLIKLDASIAQYEPQAHCCELAFLKFTELSMKKALTTLKDFGQDSTKQYFTKTVYTYPSEKTVNGVIVYNSKERKLSDSVQYDLLELGLAKINTKKPLPDSYKELLEAQKKAQTKGIGMWTENDKSDDEEGDF